VKSEPRSHVGPRKRIVRPEVPVEHLQLWCWFYPRSGDGGLELLRWAQRTDAGDEPIHSHQQPLTFITADQVVPAMLDQMASGIARMTQWQLLSDALRQRYGEPRPATFLDPPVPPTPI
jgi:hypothetical protein